MARPIQCRKEWVLRGGHLRGPIVLEVEESYGEAWWRINSGNKGLSDFLSKDSHSVRPLSNTNLFEVLKQARNEVSVLSACQSSPAVAGRDEPAAALYGTPVVAPKSQRRKHPTATTELPAVLIVSVPIEPGASETVELLCLDDGRPSVSIAISDRAFQWLFTWASRDIAAGGFKRKQNGAARLDRVFSGTKNVSWSYQRRCWVARYKMNGKWKQKEFSTRGTATGWGLRMENAKQSAIQFVTAQG